MSEDPRQFAPATARNRDAILGVLRQILPADGTVLEIASGSGEHAVYFTPRLEGIHWLASDANEAALASIKAWINAEPHQRLIEPIHLDVTDWKAPVMVEPAIAAIFCANMIHIAPWAVAVALFAGAARQLTPGAPLILYGPYRRDGRHTAPSNESFEDWLKAQDPQWGLRDLEGEVMPLAAQHGFGLEDIIPMPANNFCLLFRRQDNV